MDNPEQTSKWEAAVGKMIFSFGSLELIMLRLYQTLMPHRDYFDDDFESRFNKIIGALRSESAEQSVIDQFIEAKNLSEIRHLVAHSSLYFDVFVNNDAERMFIEQNIRDLRDMERTISLPDLEKAAARATVLSQNIHDHFSKDLWGVEG